MSIKIRSERLSDPPAIESLIAAAFHDAPHASHTEQFIVNALRRAEQLSVSLIATDRDSIVGHVCVSPIIISDGSRAWYGLGPLAVAPAYQGRKIGSRLVEQALLKLRGLHACGCVVLGEPDYYRRFGFEALPGLTFPGAPSRYFQAIIFANDLPSGIVSYHEAFNARS
ncbi:GNAT family N-acetyltransferase [Noviherbaspirillum aerium]|uniref:GNAT family N-acetyltransferase n=1 Tax=Noviherbaspirillum aerium TaxID=2588497 RepID=UPI00124D2393|nr:N-acetyltransferase [Noviherbaspirillum aerium]